MYKYDIKIYFLIFCYCINKVGKGGGFWYLEDNKKCWLLWVYYKDWKGSVIDGKGKRGEKVENVGLNLWL